MSTAPPPVTIRWLSDAPADIRVAIAEQVAADRRLLPTSLRRITCRAVRAPRVPQGMRVPPLLLGPVDVDAEEMEIGVASLGTWPAPETLKGALTRSIVEMRVSSACALLGGAVASMWSAVPLASTYRCPSRAGSSIELMFHQLGLDCLQLLIDQAVEEIEMRRGAFPQRLPWERDDMPIGTLFVAMVEYEFEPPWGEVLGSLNTMR